MKKCYQKIIQKKSSRNNPKIIYPKEKSFHSITIIKTFPYYFCNHLTHPSLDLRPREEQKVARFTYASGVSP